MRATPEGDDSDFTDDGYGYENDAGKAYYVDESRLGDDGKGDHKYNLQDEGSDSEYDDSESEEDGEGTSEGDTSASDSSDDDSDHSDNAATERKSNLEVAQSAKSSELSSADLVKTAREGAAADPIATSIEKNDGTEVTAKPAPEPPVTPTKPARAPLRAVSQLSPQRRQTPMLSPPASSIKTNSRTSFSGISAKASAAVFSKEM
ncbi:hypothetical protein EYR36_009946 [Pleurotus pulmonarius]|nr:hypothetical protein EYR36_009946 [Pleurotus pulmonarius]KAF4593424.1 hypothetical protein EYR38_009138 [Pleurotus pulmonarius]